jgi:CO dehydrogenase/acetyl-CoA synthase epsilon subunit
MLAASSKLKTSVILPIVLTGSYSQHAAEAETARAMKVLVLRILQSLSAKRWQGLELNHVAAE